MDNFAVDLDQVLDDFELSQSDNNVRADGELSDKQNRVSEPLSGNFVDEALPKKTIHVVTSSEDDSSVDKEIQFVTHSVPYTPPENLDLSEANFAPSPPKSLTLVGDDISSKAAITNGGYFVPETGHVSEVCDNYCADDGSLEHCNENLRVSGVPSDYAPGAPLYTTSPITYNSTECTSDKGTSNGLTVGDINTTQPLIPTSTNIMPVQSFPTNTSEITPEIVPHNQPELLQDSHMDKSSPAQEFPSKDPTESISKVSQPDVVPTTLSAVVGRVACHELCGEMVGGSSPLVVGNHCPPTITTNIVQSEQNSAVLNTYSEPNADTNNSLESNSLSDPVNNVTCNKKMLKQSSLDIPDGGPKLHRDSSEDRDFISSLRLGVQGNLSENTDCKQLDVGEHQQIDASAPVELCAHADSKFVDTDQNTEPTTTNDNSPVITEVIKQPEMQTNMNGDNSPVNPIVAGMSEEEQNNILNNLAMDVDISAPEVEGLLAEIEMPSEKFITDRKGSEGSMEKFLSLPITSPANATPMEEEGFSKVPGFTPHQSASSAEVVNDPKASGDGPDSANGSLTSSGEFIPDSPQIVPSAVGENLLQSTGIPGVGARPKQIKKNRPNSLLGLSKPDLPPLVPQELAQNHAVITGDIASDCSDPNQNSDISSQLAQPEPSNRSDDNSEIGQPVFDSRALLSQNTVNSCDPRLPLLTSDQLLPTTQVLSMAHPSVTSVTLPVMSRNGLTDGQMPLPPPYEVHPPGSLNLPPPATDYSSGGMLQLPDMAQQEPSSPNMGKQNRPTSLALPPRGEAPSQRRSPVIEGIPGLMGPGQTGALPPHMADNLSQSSMTPTGSTCSTPSQTNIPPLTTSEGGVPQHIVAPLPGVPTSSNINLAITQLGKVAPHWVPDMEAANCMQCELRFTFTKRRHHCRACGKVFCSTCCCLKSKLEYLESKEARVCSKCYQDLIRAQVYERIHQPSHSPNPNNPSEYCSTVPPTQQVASNAMPPTVMVPVGVLRKEGSSGSTSQRRSAEPKQVMFSDGIRPGGDLTELDGPSESRIPQPRSGRRVRKVERTTESKTAARVKMLKVAENRSVCFIPEYGLPPVVRSTNSEGVMNLEENPNTENLMLQIRNAESENHVVFRVNRNLFVMVKIANLDCCVNRVCWCFTTKGMCTVGQEEIVIVLECPPEENQVPRDIFCHFQSVYEEASRGNTVSNMGHTIFAHGFLDSNSHGGFLYVRPSFQCLQKLIVPSSPYVCGVLLQKWETPWAKVFPVRLMLRLGAEYRYYPCPLISVRHRKPVYGEIGHTIMNLLADFRNYQYMLPQMRGVFIHMEDKQTCIKLPRNRYDEVMKVVSNSNEHVMALGASFSTEADSHLVCLQNEDGNYHTQAINIQNKPRRVTGASFVVFNGALKTSSGLRAKSSIVEDGLMVQITTEMMVALKQAMCDMQDFSIGCGSLDVAQPEETVVITWTEDDRMINIGVKSPIDNMPMDGVESIHIHNSTDYAGDEHKIRWTEVFFIRNEDQESPRCEPVDLSRLAETLAQACCVALTPHLKKLKDASLTKLGLRVTIDSETVGYEIGASGQKLPDVYMNELDNELIPVIHSAAANSQEGPVTLELILFIID